MSIFADRHAIERRRALSEKIRGDIERFFADHGHIKEIPPGVGQYSADTYYDTMDAEEEIKRFFL